MKKLLLRPVSAAERTRLWLLKQSWFHGLLSAMPRQMRWLLRTVYLAPIDLADRVLGRRDAGLPSKAGTFTGAFSDFEGSGEALVKALGSVAGATPSSRVLDVGCGVGRLAVAMRSFLDADGGYEGLDIVPKGIEWCQEHISSPHGNMHFTLADIYNKEYNPKGRLQAADYRFPYEDESFDVAVLYSVFTHMLPAEVDRYVSELSRVLKKGGHIFATYFVITPQSRELMDSKGSQVRFKHNHGPYWVLSERVPELAVAYEESHIRELYSKHGLSDPPDLYLGRWCGRGTQPDDLGVGDQDVVVTRKL